MAKSYREKNNKVLICTEIELEKFNKFRQIAKMESRSMSAILRMLINEKLEKELKNILF